VDEGSVAAASPLATHLVSAFQLPPNPEDLDAAGDGGYDSDGTEAGETHLDGSAEAAVRVVKGAFLRFFAALFEKLPDLFVMPPASMSARAVPADFFDDERLVSSCPEASRDWLGLLLHSQAFTEFLHDRLTGDGSRVDIAFFDESIDAKRNRSRRVLTKRPTPLLAAGHVPAGYRGRPPPRPVRLTYESLCEAAGRANRPAPATRVGVLVVAGGGLAKDKGRYGSTLAAFTDQLRREFARDLLWTRLADAASGMAVVTVSWHSAGYQHFGGYTAHGLQGAKGLEDTALREAIFDLEASAGAAAAASAASPELERARTAIAAGLAQLAQQAGASAPLCLVAHGAGGLVAIDYFQELQRAASDGAEGVGSGPVSTPMQRGETLASVATLGVPISSGHVLTSTQGLQLSVPAPGAHATWPKLRGTWLHFFHREDALSAPLGALVDASVVDLECRARPGRKGIEASPHLLYLCADASKEVLQPVARAFAQVWQDSNIVQGGAANDVQAIESRLSKVGAI